MSEGVRPAHQAVMLEEAVAGLNVRANGVYVDGTFGRGGHSRSILQLLGNGGRLIAIDRDLAAVEAGRVINDSRFTLLHGWFGELQALLASANVSRVDGILLDLGMSSPQLDDASRGFSFRFDAPLDMRMDQSRGVTAGEWLLTADESEIREVIKNHGEERFAKQIAAAIVAARARGDIGGTRQLATLVAHAIPSRESRQEPATRTFQALRIHVNRELEELSLVLPQCVPLLNPGGRLAVVSFHSLEDRMVKRFMREAAEGRRLPERLPLRASELPKPPMRLVGRAQRPDEAEVARNPRAQRGIAGGGTYCGTHGSARGAMTRLNLVLLAVLIACALALVTSQHKARKLYVQLQHEQELEKKHEIEWSQLQLEQSTWSGHARVEKIASQQLRMRAPTAARTQVAPLAADGAK